ncbi:MAG: AIR synthase [Synechococcaceae cyanobacterium]|nr:AIR synthase [Synechococcaceae cyanobacterium]
MPKGHNLRITPSAAAELCRQAAVAGTPGLMHIDLLDGTCERWCIRLRPGHLAGTPVARADGVTLHAPAEQLALLNGLLLDYKGDLSGGGFLVRSGPGGRSCACGAAFSRAGEAGTPGQ